MTLYNLRFGQQISLIVLMTLAAACNGNDPTKYKPQSGSDAPPIIPIEVYQNEIPRRLPEYEGDFFQAKKWQDNNGENLLILTTNTEYFGYDMTSKSIHGFHYTKSSGEYALVWKMNDFVNDCEFDAVCEFFTDGTTITDLDNNRMAEIKLQYKLNCTSDVSRDGMKLLLYEGGKKRALRGERWLDYNNMANTRFPFAESQLSARIYGKSSQGGRYETDEEFLDAPPAFLEFAKREWVNHVVQMNN